MFLCGKILLTLAYFMLSRIVSILQAIDYLVIAYFIYCNSVQIKLANLVQNLVISVFLAVTKQLVLINNNTFLIILIYFHLTCKTGRCLTISTEGVKNKK